jgi:hypothetical protein
MELERVPTMPDARTPAASDPAGARGAVTWVTLLLLVAIAGGAYLAVVFGPAWVLHYEVKQVVRDYGNRAVKDPDDAGLLRGMVDKVRSLQMVKTTDDAGRPIRVPVVDVEPKDVVWERTPDPPTLHVEFEYARELELPGLNRTLPRVYRVDERMDISRAKW